MLAHVQHLLVVGCCPHYRSEVGAGDSQRRDDVEALFSCCPVRFTLLIHLGLRGVSFPDGGDAVPSAEQGYGKAKLGSPVSSISCVFYMCQRCRC
jgi:hypothetical protein